MRLPFFYGWVIVAAAFVTMGLGVNARTAFSLLVPPIIDELGWDRGLTAGAFSFGFLLSAVLSPLIGRSIDRHGPRIVIEAGIVVMATGLLLTPRVHEPWQLYAVVGALVGSGSNCLGYTTHALFLPSWFVRRRGLAMSLAFSGVGVGSVVVLPWLQGLIERVGWRDACWTLGIVALVTLVPLNLVLRRRPEELGLQPDGGSRGGSDRRPGLTVVDPAWAAIDWTLGRALRAGRFWWVAVGYFSAMWAWYAVQVHQTKYLVEVGFSAAEAAWALGFVSLIGVPGQIALGALSDRIGREWIWAIGNAGFVTCYAVLLRLPDAPEPSLLYAMVAAQGLLGYGLTSVLGAIPAELFQGRDYGTIFGTLVLAAIAGGAAGPWVTGVIHDATGRYALAFGVAIGANVLSALSIWLAAPRKVRAVVPVH